MLGVYEAPLGRGGEHFIFIVTGISTTITEDNNLIMKTAHTPTN